MDQYRKFIAALVTAGVSAALQFLPLSDTWRGWLLVLSTIATAASVWAVPNAPTAEQRAEVLAGQRAMESERRLHRP